MNDQMIIKKGWHMAFENVQKETAEIQNHELTTQQKNIWNLQKYYEGTAISNICSVILYEGSRDLNRLAQSVLLVVEEQTALRLRFSDTDPVTQYVSDEKPPIEIRHFYDRSEMDLYADKIAKEPMPLINSPMCAFTLFRLGTRTGIIAKLSHLIADAWTFELVADRINMYYGSLNSDESRKTGSSGIGKAGGDGDYLVYVQDDLAYRASERFEKDRKFWKEKYAEKPESCAMKLSDLPRALDIKADRIRKKLSAELSGRIRSFCRGRGVTEAVVFESAVLLYLARVNPENRTCTIGLPVLNRKRLQEKRTAGMFISTMPLKVDMDASETAGGLLKKVTAAKREMFRHQKYPYEEILRAVRNDHGFTGNLFDVMVSVQDNQIHGENGYQTKWYSNGYNEVPFVLSVDHRDSREQYSLTADYQTAVFPDEAEAYAVLERLEYIVSQIVAADADDQRKVSEIDILPAAEKDLLLEKFNDTHVDYPSEKCVHELFAEQARRTPDRAALLFEGQEFTYRQIDEMSDSLAWSLRKKGVGRNEVVPIIARRDWRIIAAMMGVLKAGGAYMPVAPDYPAERVAAMLEIAGSRIALCYGYHDALPVEAMDLETFDFHKTAGPIENINSSEDLCYIIFTSGSTGKPKGVSITHANVGNYAHNNPYNVMRRIIRDDDQTIVSVTNIVFDIFVTESLLPLMNGLTICMANDEETVSQKKLARLIEKNKVDVIQTTPTKMRSYLMDRKNLSYLQGVKAVVMGGEAFPSDLYTELRSVADTLVYNIYGPAETTVWSSIAEVHGTDRITIGVPIANTQIYILDKNQKLLPAGVAGELCIAGAGVGKGYLNRPDLTAERFIPNPFATEENGHGKVLYRTGDLAGWRIDGQIEYFGRMDTQVKIRGLRIELGEIESVMAETEGIGLVAVAAQKDGSGRQYLAGYYTSAEAIDEKEMRRRLAGKLPKYMVPNYFMRLEHMTMTASGKTDRKNLPVPDVNTQEREYVPPRTEQEEILCGIMAEVLSVSRFGITDDFFELGGDSLGAISVIAMAHEKGIELGLQTLFDHPNVRDLCATLEQAGSDAARSTPAERHRLPMDQYKKYHDLLCQGMADRSARSEQKETGNVFLTGTTGFLGAHILDVLMKETDGKVYCLVRKGQGRTPAERLADNLRWYFGETYTDEISHRIVPVEGDIRREGLSDALPEDVRTVIHTAATVKHYGAYDYFKKINVEGTRHVASYARRIRAQLIHISTISVSGNAMADGNAVYRSEEEKNFTETDYYIGQPLDNVYIRSKFEAEQAVMDEILEHGLDAKIIRIGNLTNRTGDFRFQPNYESNAFLKRLKAILELGLFPDYLMPLYSEFSPVDLTAEGIVKIIQYAKGQIVFHLYSNRPLYHGPMLEILRANGIALKTVTGKEFYKGVEVSLQRKDREFIFKSLINDMDADGTLIYDSNIHIKNDYTVRFMARTGFEWNEIDGDYIRGYLDYFRKAGFLHV